MQKPLWNLNFPTGWLVKPVPGHTPWWNHQLLMRRLMAQEIPIVSRSECAVIIMTAWGFFNKTVLAWGKSACQKPSYPLKHDHQLNRNSPTKRHFLCHEIAHGHVTYLRSEQAFFFSLLFRGSSLHHGPHCKVVRMGFLPGPAMLDGDLCPRVLLLPCCSRKLYAHLCLLSHLFDGVTQNPFCKTAIQIIFFSFIKVKMQQLHKYLEQETSGTNIMQLKVTGQDLYPGLKKSCLLPCSKMQAQPPRSSAWTFSSFLPPCRKERFT